MGGSHRMSRFRGGDEVAGDQREEVAGALGIYDLRMTICE